MTAARRALRGAAGMTDRSCSLERMVRRCGELGKRLIRRVTPPVDIFVKPARNGEIKWTDGASALSGIWGQTWSEAKVCSWAQRRYPFRSLRLIPVADLCECLKYPI